jgi:spore cortex biosynthesis protein YabQ
MSEVITGELRFLAVSIVWGGGIAVCYEFLRLMRLLFRHGEMWTGLEDLLFWTICAVLIFIMVMEENDGMIRWYVLAGCAAGACIYQYLLHPVLVFLLTPLTIPVRYLRRFFRNWLQKREKAARQKASTPKETSEGERELAHISKEKKRKTKPPVPAGHRAGRGGSGGGSGLSDAQAAAKGQRLPSKIGRR